MKKGRKSDFDRRTPVTPVIQMWGGMSKNRIPKSTIKILLY